MIASVADHLWQSTLFAGAAALLTVAFRHNRASVRHGIWFAASLKFLVPFALLMVVGGQLEWRPVPGPMASSDLASTVVQVSQPFDAWWPAAPSSSSNSGTLRTELTMLSLWLGGVLAVSVARIRLWRRVRELARSGRPWQVPGITVPAQLEVCSVPGVMEPGVIGWRWPILMMPADIAEHLTRPQLKAVVMHELCHVHRRDNLTAGIQMVVEALFWFYPPVWWIGARMVSEREKACDEAVLTQGVEPRTYAEAILNVCKRYVAVPLVSVSGVGGADLRRRLESIAARRIGARVGIGGGVALGISLVAAIASPIIVGALETPQDVPTILVDGGQLDAAFSVVSVRPTAPSSTEQRGIRPLGAGGRFRAVGVTLRDLIRVAYGSQAALLSNQIAGGPRWAESAAFDIVAGVDDTAATGGQLTAERLFAMLRTMLKDSFKLRLHNEARDLPIYELVVSRQDGQLGGTLKPTTNPCVAFTSGGALNVSAGVPICGFRRVSPTNLSGMGVTMELLAGVLASVPDVGRPVRDRTGLKGGFDLDVTFTPLAAVGQSVGLMAPDGAPQLSTALQEQLGLRLQSSRGLVDVFVIDSAEIPPAN